MDERPTRVRSRAAGWAVAAVATMIITLMAIVAITRSPSEFGAGTPEAAAQSYLQALLDGDARAAHAALDERLQARCSITDLREAWMPESVRITLAETILLGDIAEVELLVIEGSSDLFGGAGKHEVTLVLEDTADGWAITEAPWPIEYCEMEEP